MTKKKVKSKKSPYSISFNKLVFSE